MAHMLLVDELVRQGVPLVKALEQQAKWAEQDPTGTLTAEEAMVRRNRQNMRRMGMH